MFKTVIFTEVHRNWEKAEFIPWQLLQKIREQHHIFDTSLAWYHKNWSVPAQPCAMYQAQELHSHKGEEGGRAEHILVLLSASAPLSPPVLNTHSLTSLKTKQTTKNKEEKNLFVLDSLSV